MPRENIWGYFDSNFGDICQSLGDIFLKLYMNTGYLDPPFQGFHNPHAKTSSERIYRGYPNASFEHDFYFIKRSEIFFTSEIKAIFYQNI